MNNPLLTGKLVRLTVEDPQTMAEHFHRWARDTEYWRLMTSYPVAPHSLKSTKEWLEKMYEKNPPEEYRFLIRTLEDDRIIGDIGLDGINWNHGDTFVGLGIGERDEWSKGYGGDAMNVILRFAFQELNLRRVSLTVFEFNPRAIRSYEKCGFRHEGMLRQVMLREGQRAGILFMGILREEWESLQEVEDVTN